MPKNWKKEWISETITVHEMGYGFEIRYLISPEQKQRNEYDILKTDKNGNMWINDIPVVFDWKNEEYVAKINLTLVEAIKLLKNNEDEIDDLIAKPMWTNEFYIYLTINDTIGKHIYNSEYMYGFEPTVDEILGLWEVEFDIIERNKNNE